MALVRERVVDVPVVPAAVVVVVVVAVVQDVADAQILVLDARRVVLVLISAQEDVQVLVIQDATMDVSHLV